MNILHKNAWYYYSIQLIFLQLSIYTKGAKTYPLLLWHMLQLFNYTIRYAKIVFCLSIKDY